MERGWFGELLNELFSRDRVTDAWDWEICLR